MFFEDRIDAGKKLAQKLDKYKNKKDLVIIGLPRGGVPVAKVVAKKLNKPLDIIVTRKIGAPFNKEYAIGAITEKGTPIFNDEAKKATGANEKYIEKEIETEKEEAERRLKKYRDQKNKLDLEEKIALIIDDGIATGFTMRAAIKSAKEKGAKKVIAAVPVTPKESVQEMEELVDEFIYLEEPERFGAIGRFYYNFDQTTDEEVIEALNEVSNI